MVLKPSEIRTIILGEHDVLRSRLAEIKAHLGRAATDAAARGELPKLLSQFYEQFLKHIAREEHILMPVLADIDNWGPIRIEQMEEEHVEQRATIHELACLQPDPDMKAYTARILAFIGEVQADMDAEERECLSRDVLRDDTTSIDAFGG
jgi:iron-sulfur cluster repair protein YtfE (RIC family)